jgi:hypothetical protein
VKISELFADPELIPTNTSSFERSMRENFIGIRLRGSQALRGTANLAEIDDSKVSSTKTQLKTELQSAAARATWVAGQMASYETAGKLVSLAKSDMDEDLLANYLPDKLIPGTEPGHLQAKRKATIASIVWWATASDTQLLDGQKGADLLKLVDRRLRAAERMFYYVAENPRSPWPPVDGGKRMFDYPASATPNPSIGAEAANFWDGPGGGNNYRFVLHPGVTPSTAIQKLFTPKPDRRQRNLFYCDQVIQSLHLEGFMEAEKNSRGDHTWFNSLVSGKPADWLRIDDPWRKKITYLVSEDETSHFEHKSIRIADLQVGDHLIVYNHPLFSAFIPTNEWQLENSMVVQVHPKLLLQGHGTPPLTLDNMIKRLLDQCNRELESAQKTVAADTQVKNPTESPGNLYPTINLSSRCDAIRRVPPSQSAYASTPDDNRKADWWLRWTPIAGREAEWDLYTKTTAEWNTRRDVVKANQKVEVLTQNTALPLAQYGFFFPLWEPEVTGTGQNRTPIKKQGKISKIHPVVITKDMVSLESLYFPSPFRRGMTVAIRPKVV